MLIGILLVGLLVPVWTKVQALWLLGTDYQKMYCNNLGR